MFILFYCYVFRLLWKAMCIKYVKNGYLFIYNPSEWCFFTELRSELYRK